jgi:hypothetical protein
VSACLLLGIAVDAQESDELTVRVKVSAGTHFVGQGFELQVGVVGAGQRPEVDRPSINGADVWLIEKDLQPISAGGIGGMVAESNLFVFRYRVVARRPGTLEIPAIRARLRDRSGRGRPVRVPIRPVPAEGRPATFLGGVGRFALEVEAKPGVVRVGQELEFRITVTGSAAWGMVDRPELKRFDRLRIAPRIRPGSADLIAEPPSRTFVYRLRPTRAGEDVLPPVSIASFDPTSSRYVTQVTRSVPVRVVAVPGFDPSTIGPEISARAEGPSSSLIWTVALTSTALLIAATLGLARVRRRTRGRRLLGRSAARQYAARLARGLGSASAAGDSDRRQTGEELGLEIHEALIRYLQIGIGRPSGALTPEEARQGVTECTGSEELGHQTAQIVARCDGVLYRDAPAPAWDDPGRLQDDARGLFAALGRVKTPRRLTLTSPGRQDSQADQE